MCVCRVSVLGAESAKPERKGYWKGAAAIPGVQIERASQVHCRARRIKAGQAAGHIQKTIKNRDSKDRSECAARNIGWFVELSLLESRRWRVRTPAVPGCMENKAAVPQTDLLLNLKNTKTKPKKYKKHYSLRVRVCNSQRQVFLSICNFHFPIKQHQFEK